MDKQWWKRIALFIAMLGFMFALLLVREMNVHDKGFTKLQLAKDAQVSYVVDLGKEGGLKYLVQPNVYSAYLRLQPQKKNVKLTCRGEGLEMMLSQGSKKGVWEKLNAQQVLQKQFGALPLSVELRVPRESVKQYHVGKGAIKLYEGEKLYATIAVEVVNSRYK